MKNLIYSFLFLISISVARAADVNAICYTSVGGTTTFIMKTENSVVNFEVFNHNGGGYAPFWSSIVVPNDLPILSKKAEIIKKLDQGFKATWNSDKCKWTGDRKFSCIGSTDTVNVNGLDIEPWAVYSSLVTDSSFAGDYEYIDMTVSFEVNKESFNYTMRYQADECILSESKISEKKPKK
ncbi:MAG: hypothetical protein ABL930_13015 [Pseudobdellovibrio sp.]